MREFPGNETDSKKLAKNCLSKSFKNVHLEIAFCFVVFLFEEKQANPHTAKGQSFRCFGSGRWRGR